MKSLKRFLFKANFYFYYYRVYTILLTASLLISFLVTMCVIIAFIGENVLFVMPFLLGTLFSTFNKTCGWLEEYYDSNELREYLKDSDICYKTPVFNFIDKDEAFSFYEKRKKDPFYWKNTLPETRILSLFEYYKFNKARKKIEKIMTELNDLKEFANYHKIKIRKEMGYIELLEEQKVLLSKLLNKDTLY